MNVFLVASSMPKKMHRFFCSATQRFWSRKPARSVRVNLPYESYAIFIHPQSNLPAQIPRMPLNVSRYTLFLFWAMCEFSCRESPASPRSRNLRA